MAGTAVAAELRLVDADGDAVAAVAVCINKAQLGSDRGARHRDAALDVARRLTQRLGGEAAP